MTRREKRAVAAVVTVMTLIVIAIWLVATSGVLAAVFDPGDEASPATAPQTSLLYVSADVVTAAIGPR